MATCKDCIHFDVCVDKLGTTKFYDNVIAANNVEKLCKNFKDKALVLDLPCNVGSKVYQFDSAGNVYESEITTIIFDTNGIAFDLKAIGKKIFMSRESAELALKGGDE